MAAFEEGDHAAESGKEKKYVLPRKAEQKQLDEILKGNPSDVLLDLSEKMLLRELKPKKYHLYSGAEDTVHGWDRVAPLSCIILSQKKSKKPKNKEGDNPTAFSADLTAHNAETSVRSAEQRSETHPGYSWSCTAIAALQLDTKEWSGYDVQKYASNDMIEEERAHLETSLVPQYHTTKYTPSGRSLSRHQRHKPNSTVVPIKNFSFLPPIESSRLSPKGGGHSASYGDTVEDRCLIIDKRRGTRVEPTDLHLQTFSHRTFQHSLSLSYTGLSISKKMQVQVSSKHDRSNALAKSLTQVLQSSPAAGAQAHLHPSYLF